MWAMSSPSKHTLMKNHKHLNTYSMYWQLKEYMIPVKFQILLDNLKVMLSLKNLSKKF